ncbi:hypothetical protein [Mahella australiensis]|uniref:Primosome, DnaD subunit n=1 Tax=Mahella australiensis (strain DSM 15567 / CIP 107919 / 50-1 BON) TaxID=697281 RepID=F3ZY07_MAHA5|nr:hypothetical protein [Mahella australiensis]AEE97703.1 hypothetical protein Mahau_2557 [Mahella australiensis 50-1 BON]
MTNNSNTIIRVKHDASNPYVIVNKTIFTDNRLSWKAKGLHAYLMSRPDDWKVMISDLINQSTDGRDSVYSGLNELIKYKYVKRERIYVNGRIGRWEYTVYEVPEVPYEDENLLPENPEIEKSDLLPGFPDQENLIQDNPPLLNKDNTNNDLNNNDINNNRRTRTNNDVVVHEISRSQDHAESKYRITDDAVVGEGATGDEPTQKRNGSPNTLTEPRRQPQIYSTTDMVAQNGSGCQESGEKKIPEGQEKSSVEEIKEVIERATGGKITKQAVTKLLEHCGEGRIRYYAANFGKFCQAENITNTVGFFIKAVEEQYPLPESSVKKNKWVAGMIQRQDTDFNGLEKVIQAKNMQKYGANIRT